MNKQVKIVVYGAEQLCASCVNLPSSKETYEWLGAAIARKFPNQPFNLIHVDIFDPPNEEVLSQFAERIITEDMFYPVVTVEGKVVGEGNPRLKVIYEELEKYGYTSKE